ncbi:acetyl-CoA C-acetyltransferase [Vagococcus zengguangii]|uniref:acetyl-CoA C-acetyltransferase n=1 Tax=Vagococcus zengguangii TaxID=2571750 RepID=A0A4D7CRA1_9ENTE|nr:acetyl-CoA C-acetyltransferase [Vagococcus zengguangii]QCI86589.1 acetyl-CoA C-acetyltransferase [Vagococcus zengguangii]
MKNVVIVEAQRTPIGKFGGAFADVSAVELGVTAAKAALNKAGIQPHQVDEVIIGNVLSAGLGQNVARQVALGLSIPQEKPAFTVNMVCGSGMKAIMLGAQAIQTGQSEVVLVGGTENMTQAPYLDMTRRWGNKMGTDEIYDSILKDGLTDAIGDYHMGITAENLSEKYQISRQAQDEFAANSQRKAIKAMDMGKFVDEIAPVVKSSRKGQLETVETDEYPRRGVTAEGIASMRPAFKRDGTVTAANASGINDGAAMLVLMSAEKAQAYNLPIMAEIISYATAGVSPDVMGEGPIPATKKALEQVNLEISDLSLVEANEAFAAQSLAVIEGLSLNPDIVNVNGGAIALGHPIGASGARIMVSLIHEMQKQGAEYGLGTLCIGGGQGASIIVKR